jgi:hypothetical protein
MRRRRFRRRSNRRSSRRTRRRSWRRARGKLSGRLSGRMSERSSRRYRRRYSRRYSRTPQLPWSKETSLALLPQPSNDQLQRIRSRTTLKCVTNPVNEPLRTMAPSPSPSRSQNMVQRLTPFHWPCLLFSSQNWRSLLLVSRKA